MNAACVRKYWWFNKNGKHNCVIYFVCKHFRGRSFGGKY